MLYLPLVWNCPASGGVYDCHLIVFDARSAAVVDDDGVRAPEPSRRIRMSDDSMLCTYGTAATAESR